MKFGEYNESKASDSYEPVVDLDSGQVVAAKPKTKSHSKEVFALFPNHPANWIVNKSQRQAADHLWEEHGLEDCKMALAFVMKWKDDPFCPQITSPWDLDTKWQKLLAFKKKHE
jgi:hypothetical protein